MKRNHLVAAVRNSLTRYPKPYDAHYGVVPLPPTIESINVGSIQADHSQAIAALGRASAIAKQFPAHFMLSRVLVRQEAVYSSTMEGTHSTLDKLLEVEETGDVLEDEHSNEAARLVRDYAIALERALQQIEIYNTDAFTLDMIQGLHRSLMREATDYKDTPGELRNLVVWVGSLKIEQSQYNPPPPNEVLRCLVDQIDYLRCKDLQQQTQSIITQMAVAHAHFEAVHPFRDGNGRVGRLLLPLMLAAQNHAPLYLSPYIAAHKSTYIDALIAAQQRLDYLPLISHLSNAIISAVDDAEVTCIRIDKLLADWHIKKKFRRGSTALRIIEVLPGHPIITAKTVNKLLGVTAKNARLALNQLNKLGILKEKTGYKRNRVYAADEVLQIYYRPDDPL